MDNLKRKIKNPNFALIALSLFIIAAFIELSYGSVYLGFAFLILACLIAYYGIGDVKIETHQRSYFQILLGLVIVIFVISYNVYEHSRIQTFDSFMLLLGISILASNTKKFMKIGRFATVFSLIFLILYTTLFILPMRLNFALPYYYGHYFITLPVVYIMKALGYDVSIPAMRSIGVYGVEPTTLKIDLACFGWYSLLLIVSLVIAYSRTIEKIDLRKIAYILALLTIASYLANLLRIAILVYIAYFYGIEKMMIVHSHLGWILFAIILLPIALYMLNQK